MTDREEYFLRRCSELEGEARAEAQDERDANQEKEQLLTLCCEHAEEQGYSLPVPVANWWAKRNRPLRKREPARGWEPVL